MSAADAITLDVLGGSAARPGRDAVAARWTRAIAHHALPFVSSALAVAAFPPLGSWPLAWIGLIPLLAFLAREPSAARRVIVSGLAGTLFFACGCVWLTRTTTPGWLALSVYAGGGSWALFAWLASSALRSPRAVVRVGVPAAAWVISEYVRGVLPANLPWLLLAHSQAGQPALIQSAAWGGAWLVSASIVAMNAALACSPRSRVAPLVIAALVVFANLARPEPSRESLGVGIVQPELSPREKTDPVLAAAVVDRLMALSQPLVANPAVKLVVWPESSYPRTLGKEPSALLHLAGLARTLGRALVTGVMTKSDRLRNSVVALDASGRVTSVYDKQRLVFVAEYLPTWIRGTPLETIVTHGTRLPHRFDFTPGESSTLLEAAGIPLAAAICVEHASFAHVRRAVAAGARVVLNIGNEGAFDGTAELPQALAIATLRAVENRISVVRVLNSGLSGVIASDGSLRVLPAGARAEVLDVPLASGAHTFYTRFGDWLVAVSALLIVATRSRDRSIDCPHGDDPRSAVLDE